MPIVDGLEPDYFAVRKFRLEAPQRFLGYPLTTDRDGWIARRILTKRCERVLDVGAGDRSFEPDLRSRGFAGTFRTMDVDRRQTFDYYSVEEIQDQFDAVIMREVVEHLPRPTFYSYLAHFRGVLHPEGVLLLSTPNPWASGWMFADYTHISPWPPADLYGVLRWAGFQRVEIVRVIWPSRLLWIKRLYWAVHSRLYDMDYAGSYLACATLAVP